MELETSPFWEFSLGTYARPGVADACLSLQNRHGVDVNVLLFCCWAAGEGVLLSRADLERVLAAVKDWQDQVVSPLRRVRHHLKVARAPSGFAHSLRSRIAEVELDAEHAEQLMLERCLSGGLVRGEPGAAERAAGNLAIYGEVSAFRWEERDRGHLAALLRGSFPDVPEEEAHRLAGVILAGSA